METITIKGELPFGYRDKDGTIHRAFTMRALTLGDMERMEEEHPELWNRGGLAVRRLAFACELQSLGTLLEGDITPELLAGLPAQDFAALSQAEEDLAKKIAGRLRQGRGRRCIVAGLLAGGFDMARIDAMPMPEAEEWYAALYPERMAAIRKGGAPRQVYSLRAMRRKHGR